MSNEPLIGLIPAAGKGMRLGLPYPKELYPVIRDNHYKPLAQFVLTNMIAAGLKHVAFVINETKHQLIGYFGNGQRFGCNISYVVQESSEGPGASTSPGLAYALDAAYHLTRGHRVCFGMPDTIVQPTDVFARALEGATGDDDAVLVLFPTDRPQKFGMVQLGDDQSVRSIVDKPMQTDLTQMWGCMVWRPRFTEFLHESVGAGVSDFALIMNSAIQQGMRFRGLQLADGAYRDLGTYDEIMEMDHRFREE